MSSEAEGLPPPLEAVLRERRLQCVFQPIVSAGEGRLFAHEALLRGQKGSLLESPAVLFAASRTLGRSGDLDMLALETAATRFTDGKFRGKLFVNVQPQTLMGVERFCTWLEKTLRAQQLAADQLVIELTEHSEHGDFGLIRQQIAELRSLGCQVAIDDFGTGRSGLKAWAELRPDFVKIDRYFTEPLHRDPVAIEILRPMLDIAHVLGSRVIAEGIENEHQLELLRGIGVDYLQGFHISRPLSEASATTGSFAMAPRPRGESGVNCAGDLCISREPLQPQVTISVALALFGQHPDWHSLPVVDAGGAPLGILRRDALLLPGKPQHPGDCGERPVSIVMDTSMLVIDERTRLDQASRLLTRNRGSRINEEFLVVRDGRYLGIGRGIELLHHITGWLSDPAAANG